MPLFLPRLSATSSHLIWRSAIIFNPNQLSQSSFSTTKNQNIFCNLALVQLLEMTAMTETSGMVQITNRLWPFFSAIIGQNKLWPLFLQNDYRSKLDWPLLLLITKGLSPATFGSAGSVELIMTTMRSLWRIGTMMMVVIINSYFSPPMMLLKWW